MSFSGSSYAPQPGAPGAVGGADSPLNRFGTLGATVLLLISSFLPWYHVTDSYRGHKTPPDALYSAAMHASAGAHSVSANGWHQIGVAAWIFAILLLVAAALKAAGVLPIPAPMAALAEAALSALTLLFVLIYLIVRLSGGFYGWGMWVGLVLFLVLGGLTVLNVLKGGVLQGFKQLQAGAAAQQNPGGTPPPPPPAPPAV